MPPQDLVYNPTSYALADGGLYESDGSADVAGNSKDRALLLIVGRLVHSEWCWFLPLSNRREQMEYGGRWQRLAACRVSGVFAY